jgi:Ca-activated chloride channel family protein
MANPNHIATNVAQREIKMKRRAFNPSSTGRPAFGLIAWLEQTKIVLPLKGVECAFNVCGDVASVEIDQLFQQESTQPLDCLYSFPLPAGAAVYRCEMRVNGRVVCAKVEERERARQLATEKKAAGYRTTLVEMERDNLFTLSLGNIQPNDLVIIRFAYFQTLDRLGNWTSFRVPFCPGVRYIPGSPLLRAPSGRGALDDTAQVPDASRISPPRIDRLHPDAAYLSVEGTVEHPLNDIQDLSSPTHPILVRPQKGQSRINLADESAVPDSDFIVRWTETPAIHVKPAAWIVRRENESFALLRLRAPAEAPVTDDYSQDIYFLIDRSGSMGGLKWQKAVEAFRAFLKELGPRDRAWATFFESSVRDLAEKPLPAADLLADRSVLSLERIGVAGGTELLPALEHILAKIRLHSAERPASLLLITDGQVGNEQEILQRLAGHASLRVHVFGIDVTINDGFLSKLATQHQGSAALLAPTDDIVGAVARVASRLRRPVFTSIRLPQGWELPARDIPDLHAGEIFLLPLKLSRQSPSSPALTIHGKLANGSPHELTLDLVETSVAAIPLLWDKRHIDFLLGNGQRSAAIELAKHSNLVCEGAAFIAWDEAEKVPIAARELYQPAMAPAVMRAVHCCSPSAGLHESIESTFVGTEGRSMRMPDAAPEPKRSIMGFLSRRKHTVSPDPALAFNNWRKEFANTLLFQNAAGPKLLECLADWCRSRPLQVEESLRYLGDLLRDLRAAVSLAQCVETFRAWAQRHLEPPFSDRALKLLEPEPTRMAS